MHGMRASTRTHGIDLEIAAVAERQHGVVTRGQLVSLGLGREAIGRRLRAGRLHRLYPAVYAVGHRVLSQRGRWMAAVLARGPGAVLSHQSAAALWGIRDHYGGPIHITSPSRTRSSGAIRAHRALLPPDEITVHDGIPVTTVPRTIFDLAAESPQAVEPALRQAEYLRLYDSLSLLDLMDRYPGHRGSRAIRAALARLKETPGRTRSDFEERFVAFLDRYGLPRPHFNAWLTVGPDRFQADCLWPDQRLIVELDSWSAHGTRSAFRSDKKRDRKLAAAGYTTTRIPWSALDDEPEEIAADLRALLGKAKA
jgi:very-short-patch-repair endonuclease